MLTELCDAMGVYFFYDSITQLAEYETFNFGVDGSSPSRITIVTVLRSKVNTGAVPYYGATVKLKLYIIKFGVSITLMENCYLNGVE